jgi:hypothetical protein
MAASFQQRRLRVTFQLAAGTFSKVGEPDTITLEDFRTKVQIHAPGGYEFAVCRLQIYGVSKDAMDRMTVINYQNLDFLRNTLRVEATDANGLFVTVFLGEVFQAFAEYSGAPDVPFVAEARSGMIGSLAPAPATSYPGPQQVSAMMAEQAKQLNLTLENNGVNTTLTDQYLGGTPLQKVQRIAAAARIQYWYLPEQGVLAIAPMGVARAGPPVLYGLDSGLVGWPKKLHVGIAFTALFVPQVFHGCKIQMASSVPACNGEWYIISMSHRLDAVTPGGAWFSDYVATPENVVIVTR